MIIVMILSSVWVTPIKSYGQTEAEISSAEDVRNTETDHGTLKKSETDSVDDEELSNNVERNAGTSLNNASNFWDLELMVTIKPKTGEPRN